MKSLLGGKKNPEQQAREAIRRKKWSKALDYYLGQLKSQDRDYAMWNLVGDLQVNCKQRTDALESWRKAMEGFSREGLYENMLGVARKALRFAPEEEDIHLQLSTAYRELEYYADSIATFRTYLKMSKRPSEAEMRGWFKKIVECEIHRPHLLEEVNTLYKEARIDDIELEKLIESFNAKMNQHAATAKAENDEAEAEMPDEPEEAGLGGMEADHQGLSMLDNATMNGLMQESPMPSFGSVPPSYRATPVEATSFETSNFDAASQLPAGEGKDHYDLGVVYTEMKLWDAAIAEFENARRDPSIKHRATLGLAHCYQATNDLQKALMLLENEREDSSGGGNGADIQYQLGVIHELLGNMQEALLCFEQIRGKQTSMGDVDTKIEDIKSKMTAQS